MSSTDGVGSSPGRPVALRSQRLPKRSTSENLCVVGIAAPSGKRKCLEAALRLNSRSNGLATTQLRPANREDRQLHGRAQAREFGGSKLTKRWGLRLVVGHDAVSMLYSNRRSVTARALCKREKEPP